MQVKARLKMLKQQKVPNPRVPRPRKSHGPRLRSRKSLTTLSSSRRSNTRECLRRSQRSSASLEPFFVRSSRLVAPLLELSSKTSTRRASSSQLVPNTPSSICTWDAKLRLLPKEPQPRLRSRLVRRRSEHSCLP